LQHRVSIAKRIMPRTPATATVTAANVAMLQVWSFRWKGGRLSC